MAFAGAMQPSFEVNPVGPSTGIANPQRINRRQQRLPGFSPAQRFNTSLVEPMAEPAAQAAIGILLDRLGHAPVTLLFAARDETRNNAVALKEWLDQRAE
jgi:uncharacterized protein YeaO (DUF488 family)